MESPHLPIAEEITKPRLAQDHTASPTGLSRVRVTAPSSGAVQEAKLPWHIWEFLGQRGSGDEGGGSFHHSGDPPPCCLELLLLRL